MSATVAELCLNDSHTACPRQGKPKDELEIVDLNIRSTVHLVKRVLTDVVDRNVTALMPGPTDTEFFERAEVLDR
ncbi:MAG TPA: hypothetical protein VH025_05195 [Solirubrobacteraceae bacterium]|nr:hypothetical protein [Solirubrobacteraceae bacterium]